LKKIKFELYKILYHGLGIRIIEKSL